MAEKLPRCWKCGRAIRAAEYLGGEHPQHIVCPNTPNNSIWCRHAAPWDMCERAACRRRAQRAFERQCHEQQED